jgi:hypothetical protein
MGPFFSHECGVPDPGTSPKYSQKYSQQEQATESPKRDAKTKD